ncbi:MAG: Mur ligase family protein, partial [Acidobacteriota bacterium]
MALPPDTAAALDRLGRFGVRLGLDRIRTLLAALGNPQADLPAVLVAGTNGKGTVAALLSSFAGAARYTVGLYTSPHLETVEERFRLNGDAIPPERLAGLIERVLATADRHLEEPPTYFEALTACALLWLAEERVDLAVLEVGLGGRFDATNAVEPVLSVITPIDLDHREHLGSTLEEIAREKAGILRRDVPALVADLPATADADPAGALAEEAERIGASLVRVGERLQVDAIQRFRPFVDPPERRQRVWLRPPSAVDVPG